MIMERSRRELASSRELMELLRDLAAEESCQYRGVNFDTYHRGYGWFKTALGVGIGGPAVGGAAGQSMQPSIGDYAKVWLPTPLGVDLFLRLRDEWLSDEDGLDAHFEIDAGNTHLARRCLEGSLSAVLLGFGETYQYVEMRDDFVEFGPLDRKPEETAADLDALIDALLAIYSDSNDDDPVEPDLGEDAPFCFHCGFTVHPGTAVCPRCQGPLDDDPDEDEDDA
jgi:hypothetical protein